MSYRLMNKNHDEPANMEDRSTVTIDASDTSVLIRRRAVAIL